MKMIDLIIFNIVIKLDWNVYYIVNHSYYDGWLVILWI